MILGFILGLSPGFRVLILSSLRSEVLFEALDSKSKKSQMKAVGGGGIWLVGAGRRSASGVVLRWTQGLAARR